MIAPLFRCCVAVLLALIPVQLSAHRGHQALTVITVDTTKNMVFVTHRMSAHDIEPILTNIAPASAPSIDDPDSEAALLAYVEDRFALQGIALNYDGQDHRGDSLSYSYSGALNTAQNSLYIRSEMFFDQNVTNSNRLLLRVNGKAEPLQTSVSQPAIRVNLIANSNG